MKYTLALDVYGTLINTSGVFNSLEKMMGDKAKRFMDTWRNRQLEYSFRQGRVPPARPVTGDGKSPALGNSLYRRRL